MAGLVPATTAVTLALASTAFIGSPAASVSSSVNVMASVQAKVSVPAAVKDGMNALMLSYIPILGWIGTSRWRAAVAQSTLETYYETTGDASYNFVIAQAWAESNGNPLAFENNYDDDTAWWGLAWLQAYNDTHIHQYLEAAETLADYIHEDWNKTKACGGGGIAWERSGPQFGYSGAIQNELFLELTAWLHNTIVENEKNLGAAALNNPYLSWATQEWTYFQRVQLFHPSQVKTTTNTIPAYLVTNSSPSSSIPSGAECGGGNIRYNIYTYNEGVILAGLAELSIATKKPVYLTDAEDIANAVLKPPTTLQVAEAILKGALGTCPHGAASCAATNSDILTYFGVLTEPTMPLFSQSRDLLGDGAAFKGIFVRDLKMLAETAHTTQYNCFFITQADSIEARDTITTHYRSSPLTYKFFGVHWEGPAEPSANETQASALEALTAAVNVPANSCPATPPTLPPPSPHVSPPPSPVSPPPSQHVSPSPSPPVSPPPSRVERCYDIWYRMPDCREGRYFGPYLARVGRGYPFQARYEQFSRQRE